MRIAVITDVHANLPALDAALGSIRQAGCDLLVHAGDAIGIGPFPRECMERLLELSETHLLMGNHDEWFARGLPEPQPAWMSDGEWKHQQWTHAQLDPALRRVVAKWPYEITETRGGVELTFLHYATSSEGGFHSTVNEPTPADLDRLFWQHPGDVIFYGHHHPFSDVQSARRYINPGSLGCCSAPEARYSMVHVTKTGWSVSHHSVPYDDMPLYNAFEARSVPERNFIYQAFFGGRFGGR